MKPQKTLCIGAMVLALLLTQACRKPENPGLQTTATAPRSVNSSVLPSAGAGTIVGIWKQALSTLMAGDGTPGLVNATGQSARFFLPSSTATDKDGNIYVADQANHVIRKITPTGQTTTFAGTGQPGADNGPASSATFNSPTGIAIDKVTGTIYVADYDNDRIRSISGGYVSTLAGGTKGDLEGWGASAKFNGPSAIAIDASNNIIVTDQNNHCIKRISGGYVSKLSGGTFNLSGFVDGTGTTSRFKSPAALGIGVDGYIYVGDANPSIRRVDYAGNTQTIVFPNYNVGIPVGSMVMDSTYTLWFSSYTHHRVYQRLGNGIIGSIGGNGMPGNGTGIGENAQFTGPVGAALDNNHNLYVSDHLGHRVRRIELDQYGEVATMAGNGLPGSMDGLPNAATFNNPAAIAVDKNGTHYVADANNHRIRKVTEFGYVTTLAGSTKGFKDAAVGTEAQFNTPTGITVDDQGNVYVADCNNHRIRKITPSGAVTTVAGQTTRGFRDGPATEALFDYPLGIGIDLQGNLFIAGGNDNRIRKISTNGIVSTVAGTGISGNAEGGPGVAQFRAPAALSIDKNGTIYVADRDNHRIRKVSQSGEVNTLAGGTQGFLDAQGRSARFNMPTGIVVDAAGMVYVTDRGNNRLRRITPGGVVTTEAGSSTGGLNDGNGFTATFNQPSGITMNEVGWLIICDWGNHCIRYII